MAASVQKALVVRKAGGELEFEEIPKPTLVRSEDSSTCTAPTLVVVTVYRCSPPPAPSARALQSTGHPRQSDGLCSEPSGHEGQARDGRATSLAALSSSRARSSASTPPASWRAWAARWQAFKPGDEVWYSGNIKRDGSFQQFQLVDWRLVSLKPKTLNWDEAAALPLTSITAYEALKEELRVQSGQSILITAGAGGVGSIATQLCKLWGLTVISTASRPETAAWTRGLGADHVVDHHKGIPQCFAEQRLPKVHCCFNTFSDRLLTGVVPVVRPFGAVCGINGDSGPDELPAIKAMFPQRISLHNEYMFGKAVHQVNEESVGKLLAEVAELVDAGKLVTTMHTKYSWRDVKKAFDYLEGRTVIGKVVMSVDENRALHP